MSLRIAAVAAPYLPIDRGPSRALSSRDPASLFNACRVAAALADSGAGPWAASNWAGGRARRPLVLMEDALPAAAERLAELLGQTRPHLLLIGCMSVCLPGAVACARLAKQFLGDQVCVVLGGKHPTESVYRAGPTVAHHPGSPLRLMADGSLPPYFDIVISGDGEHVIAALGERMDARLRAGLAPAGLGEELDDLAEAPGRWIAGAVIGGAIRTVTGRGPPVRYDALPAPCEGFGVSARFTVNPDRLTAHVFSDTGGTCVYDCAFCSERRAAGAIRDLETSPDRLYRQLEAAVHVIHADAPGTGAAAFVEDSTLLTFAPRLVERFVGLLRDRPLPIRIGGQLTIDQVLSRPELLGPLRRAGVDYLFVGVETFAPGEVGGMSKDVRRRVGSWIDRAEQAVRLLTEADIRCGIAILFGMGEAHGSRLALLERVAQWRRRYAAPWPVSLNWAVQHPLFGLDGGTGYRYVDWAIPEGPFLSAFRDFGEASVRYPLAGCPAPILEEVLEVRDAAEPLLMTPVTDSRQSR